jgi:nucleoside-diphosphate-sugar epimerase
LGPDFFVLRARTSLYGDVMTHVFVTGGSGFLGGRLISTLRARGDRVLALARSERAVRRVESLGAEAIRGDLDDRRALDVGARGAHVVFHCAALAEEWGPWDGFHRANVLGTANVARAARTAGARLVHVSTEAILCGRPLVRVDEAVPPPIPAVGFYGESKRQAEDSVRRSMGEGLDAVICRPRLIWGKGDTTLLPALADKVRKGRFAWIGEGMHLTSTCHVDNAVQGLLLAAERGKKGEIYYFTDGEPRLMRDFLGAYLATVGVDAGSKSVSLWLAKALASVCELVWRLLGKTTAPPITKMAVLLAGEEVTIVDSKARRDLGYAPAVTVEGGLAEMAVESRERPTA